MFLPRGRPTRPSPGARLPSRAFLSLLSPVSSIQRVQTSLPHNDSPMPEGLMTSKTLLLYLHLSLPSCVEDQTAVSQLLRHTVLSTAVPFLSLSA